MKPIPCPANCGRTCNEEDIACPECANKIPRKLVREVQKARNSLRLARKPNVRMAMQTKLRVAKLAAVEAIEK